ncbi:hypothetical protein HDZ31DRAFT_77930, partial [Schizophyllum fasciatum]
MTGIARHSLPVPVHAGQSTSSTTPGIVPTRSREAAITEAAAAAGLEHQPYRRVHEFAASNWDTDMKLSLLNVTLVSLEAKLDKLTHTVENTEKTMHDIRNWVEQGWIMKAPLQDAVKELMMHYAIKPTHNPDSDKMVQQIVKYIFTHPRAYELEKVKDSQIVRAVITAYVRNGISNCRSAVRKDVFEMVKSGIPLKEFATALTDSYHLPPKPTTFDDEVLAYFALMRKTAVPLASKKNTKGNDTGFWRDLESACHTLYAELGETNDRTTPAWR